MDTSDTSPLTSAQERFLQAAETLLDRMRDDGKLDMLLLLRPTDIAAEAGRSKASLYHAWGDETMNDPKRRSGDRLMRFRQELMRRILTKGYDPPGLADRAQQVEVESFSELVRDVANFEFDRYAPGAELAPDHRLGLMLTASSQLSGNPLSGMFGEEFEALNSFYLSVFNDFGLKLDERIPVLLLSTMLSATLDGFVLEAGYSDILADTIEWSSGKEWTPFAILVDALLKAVTSPRECDMPGCGASSNVVIADGRDVRSALCSAHLGMALAGEARGLRLIVMHVEPDEDSLVELLPIGREHVVRQRWKRLRAVRAVGPPGRRAK